MIRLRLGPLQLAALQCHTDPATLAADGSALEFEADRADAVWSWLTEAVAVTPDLTPPAPRRHRGPTPGHR